jgi:hypothetical protein
MNDNNTYRISYEDDKGEHHQEVFLILLNEQKIDLKSLNKNIKITQK